jgi:diguanylate cyclase (GGDEF)-like protein
LASLSLELSKLLAQKDSQIEHISNYDHLTNLPGRGLFFVRLNQILKQAQISERSAAILVIDLDYFNATNDSFGYEAGDELLRTVAKKLGNIVGENNNTLARIGSDEFGLLLADIKDSEAAGELARQILNSFNLEPVSIFSNNIFVGISIGISIYPFDGLDANTLIKSANSALCEAKKKGNCYVGNSTNN